MKPIFALAIAASLAFSAAVRAAPPEKPAAPQSPSHTPTRGVTPDMLLPAKPPKASELPNKGKVLSVITSPEGYTYVEVGQGKDVRWVVGPDTPLKVGDTVAFSDGPVMTNFYSKTLKRSFASILFADHIATLPSK